MSTDSQVAPVITPSDDPRRLFDIDGLDWPFYGHIARTPSLAVARAVAIELERLGYEQLGSRLLSLGAYEFSFDLPGGRPGLGNLEIVEVLFLPNSHEDAPHWQVSYLGEKNELLRFGTHTFVGKDQVEGYYLSKAYERYGKDNVTINPTLFW